MSSPFIGEIRIFSFGYPPRGWMTCSGQILPINQNQALFSLLGTFYGGNGMSTFALPDLRGRVPIHSGNPNYGGTVQLGQKSGEEAHTLTIPEMPTHTHLPVVGNNSAPTENTPIGNFWAQADSGYSTGADSQMSPNAVGNNGSSQGHENRSPYLTLSICIALTGIFPPRN